jgi:hypothetical protein
MIQRVALGDKYKGPQGGLGNKVKNVMRQGQKVMNKPIVKGALMIGAAVGGAALATRENKQLTQLQSNTNINNTGVGADYFKIPNAPGVKPFTEEAFPTMVFRE